MGKSDKYIIPFYKEKISQTDSPIALLGFSNNDMFDGDLYGLSLGNWNINSEWELDKKYNTIICTRCAYFAKDPEDFITRCYNSLGENGLLYVDWGLGDHWRYKDFKVGWLKGEEHEGHYFDGNFLWSTVWDDSFLEDGECKRFSKAIKKYGYEDLKASVKKEVPYMLTLNFVKKYFDVRYDILTIEEPYLQMYILLSCRRLR